MKKILFSVAALALLATAGCTRNEDNGVKGDAEQITFTGEFAAANEFDRVEFLPSDNAVNHEINWNPGDKIGICYTTEPAFMGFNNPYVATTTTAAATTKFEADADSTPIKIDKGTTNTFYAYCPYNVDIFAAEHSVSNFPSPLRQRQAGDPTTYTYPNATFLVASKAYAGEDVVSFQFSNAFPVMMIGLTGDAKIDGVRIQAPEGCNIFMEGTLDLTKIPAQGATREEFTNGFFTVEPETEMNALEIAFDTPLALNDGDVTYFPVMVAPFDYAVGDVFTFTIFGTSKNGSTIAIERTITVKEKDGKPSERTLGAGQSLDIDFNARLAKEDFGQGEGEVPGPGSDAVFEDDFSYICGIFENPENTLDPYGWTENRCAWPKDKNDKRFVDYKVKNHVGWNDSASDLEGISFENLAKAKGWNVVEGALYGYNINNGMMRLGNGMCYPGMTFPMKQPCTIALPLTGIIEETTDLTLTLKAARHTDRYGMPEVAASKLTVSVDGGALINGAASVELAPQDPFTLYEYTLPITGATAETTITFALVDKNQICVYLDDVKLTVAAGETANTEGTAVEKEADRLLYTNAVDDEFVINADADEVDENGNYIPTENERFEFVCSGAWYIDSEYPCEDGAEGWCQLTPVNWNDKLDTADEEYRLRDMYGNGIRNNIGIAATKPNTTGAPRSCTLNIMSYDTYAPIARITITQPASTAAPEPVDYGTQVLNVNWEEGDAVNTPHITGTLAESATISFTEEAMANFVVDDYYGQAGNTGLGFVNVCPETLEHGNVDASQPYQFEVKIPLNQIPESATKIVVTCDGYKPDFHRAGGNCAMEVVLGGYFQKSIINNDTPDSTTDWFTVANEFEISPYADPEWDDVRIFIYTYIGPNDNGLANALIDNINVYYK